MRSCLVKVHALRRGINGAKARVAAEPAQLRRRGVEGRGDTGHSNNQCVELLELWDEAVGALESRVSSHEQQVDAQELPRAALLGLQTQAHAMLHLQGPTVRWQVRSAGGRAGCPGDRSPSADIDRSGAEEHVGGESHRRVRQAG